MIVAVLVLPWLQLQLICQCTINARASRCLRPSVADSNWLSSSGMFIIGNPDDEYCGGFNVRRNLEVAVLL